jgi:thiol-disulfide isomerase/thioredoxin
MKMARYALLLLLLAPHPSNGTLGAPLPPDRWLNGAAGYSRALELQREFNVPLVVYFYTDWCPYCRNLDSRYLPSAEMQDYLSRVVKVRINPEFGKAERELATSYGVSGYPTFLLMRTAAAHPIKVHPFRNGGDLTPAQFAQACVRAAPVSRKPESTTGNRAISSSSSAGSPPSMTRQERKGGVQITSVTAATVAPRVASTASLPTVGEVVARYIEALGGEKAQVRLTSRVAKGRVDVPGVSYGGRLESFSVAPNRSLTTMNLDGLGTIREGFDGRVGWEQSERLGIRTVTGAKLAGLARDSEFHGALKLNQLYQRLRLVGKVKEGFREAYLLQASPRLGAPEMLYFDVETGLLIRFDMSRPTARGVVRSEVYLSDWREVDGVKIPFSRTQSMPGMTFIVTLEEVQHNLSIDTAIFRKPEG